MTTTTHAPTRANGRPLPGASAADDLLPPPAIRKGLRRAQGLTQHQAAALFGVSYQSIGNWEQRRPGPRHMPRYLAQLMEWAERARAMGFHVNWPTPAEPQK
jgi:Helix-turn-helix